MPSAKKRDTAQFAAYAERRANASMQMLAELSTGMSMWVDVGTKEDISLSKTASDWKVFCANRATTTIDTTLHQLIQTLFQATETAKYQEFMRAMWGDAYLDARVIEIIGADAESSAATTLALQRNNPSIFHKTHKRTSIKWFAMNGKSKMSKAQEFHLVEFVGLVYDKNRIQSAYIYQESLGKTAELPLPHQTHASTNYERVRVDGLLLKFEALELPTGGEYVLMSMALQRMPSLFDFGFKNPAEELVFKFAKGFRDALRRTSNIASSIGLSQFKFAQTSSWVRDQDRPSCSLCARSFNAIMRRRHHCRVCGEVVCFQCSNLFAASSLPADPTHSSYIQGDVRLCNRCVIQKQAESGRSVSLLSADALQMWLDEELSENNPDLFDVPPTQPRRPLPSGGAFTGTLEVNSLVSPPKPESSKKKSSSAPSTPLPDDDDVPITLGTTAAAKPTPEQTVASPRPNNNAPLYGDETPAATTSSIHLGAGDRDFENDEDEDDQGPIPVQLNMSFITESRSSSTSSHRTVSPTPTQEAMLTLKPLLTTPQNHYPQTAPRLTAKPQVLHRRARSLDVSHEYSSRALYIDPKYLQHQLPPHSMSTDSPVCTASAWASVGTSTRGAVASAMKDLRAKLHSIHFLVVGFSDSCDAIDVMAALEQEAPGVPYVGGLSARGICDENAWVSMKKDNGLVSLWGIHDPEGIYAVGTVGYDEGNAKVAASDAASATLRQLGQHAPVFCLVYACPLVVDEALCGIRDAVSCPVLGGCSVLSTQYQGHLQISSAGGTSIGMAFAICSPSVETSVGWFSGYETVHPSECIGVVTAADPETKLIYEIDRRPAATVYREWLRQADVPDMPMKFPRLGYMFPLGQVVETNPQVQVSSTPVVTALDDLSGAISTTTPIRNGTTIALMRTSVDLLKDAVRRMAYSVQQDQTFALSEVDGCLVFLSAGVQVVLGSSLSMSGLVGAYKRWSNGASLLGLTSFGEIGHLAGDSTPQCDALMFSWLAFSSRRRHGFGVYHI